MIDWGTAARGDPLVDVATSWLLMAAGQIATSSLRVRLLEGGRARMINRFLAEFDQDAVRQRLRHVVEWKLNDTNMTAAEHRAMRKLAQATADEPHEPFVRRR